MVQNEGFKLTLFFLYTILYEFMVWGLVASSIYFLHWNEWTVLVGLLMSATQLGPSSFGIYCKLNKELEEH